MSRDKFPFSFDPQQLSEMFKFPDLQKMMSGAEFPGANIDAIMNVQKNNFAALMEMNKVAMEGYQEIFRRQAQQIEAAAAEARDQISAVQGQPLSVEQAERNLSAVKAAVEKAIENARELAELAQKVNTSAFDVLSARFEEAVNEFKSSAGKAE